jgi:hypothetical protein
VVLRDRKVKALALFWTLVLGFGAGGERTLAGLRRHFEQASGVSTLSNSSGFCWPRNSKRNGAPFRSTAKPPRVRTRTPASASAIGAVTIGGLPHWPR